MRLKYSIILFIALIISSCGSKSGSQQINSNEKKLIKLKSPVNNSLITKGQAIDLLLEVNTDSKVKIDSISWQLENGQRGAVDPINPALKITTDKLKVGKQKLLVKTYKSDGSQENKFAQLKILSSIEPKQYGYELVKDFAHDKTSYTQGLLVHNGYLFESTGQRGMSKVRKLDIENNKVLQEFELPSSLFGEGLAYLNDRFYQLTWTSGQGFVYDVESLKPLGNFSFSGEGWGLTSNGKHLIMSNGSNELLFIDPETFKVVDKLEVMDNKKAITKLNELEYVNGEIWANYYEYNNYFVYRIDSKTGEVLGIIDFTGIVKKEDFHEAQDVFNGIAYDAENDKIYVTGKNYNKIYQVRITDK